MNYTVESPTNKTNPYIQVHTVKVGVAGKFEGDKAFHYEDSIISIEWELLEKAYHFFLLNKSDQTFKINWDDIAYVSNDGYSGKMLHGNSNFMEFKTADPYKKQVLTTIPRRMKYEDYLIPVKNFKRDDDEWDLNEEFYRHIKASRSFDMNKIEKQKGNTYLIQIPIVVDNVQYDYIFSFQVNDIETSGHEKVFSKGLTGGLIGGLCGGVGLVTLILLVAL